MSAPVDAAVKAVNEALSTMAEQPRSPIPVKAPTLPVTPVGTDAMLDERGKTHGDFFDHAEATQSLKRMMRASKNWDRLNDMQVEALDMIAHKIGRILAGDPNYKDHWDDLAGYARLVAQRL